MDGIGCTLEQKQSDGSIRPIVLISRAALDSERSWTPLDLEADAIVRAIKDLRGYLRDTTFGMYSDHQPPENLANTSERTPHFQRWLAFLTVYTYTCTPEKAAPVATVACCLGCRYRLPMQIVTGAVASTCRLIK